MNVNIEVTKKCYKLAIALNIELMNGFVENIKLKACQKMQKNSHFLQPKNTFEDENSLFKLHTYMFLLDNLPFFCYICKVHFITGLNPGQIGYFYLITKSIRSRVTRIREDLDAYCYERVLTRLFYCLSESHT